MKKGKLFALLGLGFLALGGMAFASKPIACAYAEPDETEPTPVVTEEPQEEVFECHVVLNEAKHGVLTVDKTEGHVGEIVNVTADHDFAYMVDFISMNGVNLIESEDTRGLYSFALVEGDNTITAKFVVDKELLGDFSEVYQEVSNGNWKSLFSVENVIRLVSFLMSSGILIVIIRYFIKDKKLEAKLEAKVEKTMNKLVPETTKEIVLSTVREFIAPYFAQIEANDEEMKNALTVFSRCLALAQENTPEAKIAITKELSSLKLSDQIAISNVEAKLKEFMEQEQKKFETVMSQLLEIKQSNEAVVAQKAESMPVAEPKQEEIVEPVAGTDNGTIE